MTIDRSRLVISLPVLSFGCGYQHKSGFNGFVDTPISVNTLKEQNDYEQD